MVKKLLLVTLGFSLAVGGFWASNAQDPMPQQPSTPTVASQTVQTDLSGTYTGTFDCEALGLSGPTTLTITGNDFTTADGKTGRIVASTTGGYTAVALQVGGTGPTPTTATTPATPPTIVSLRARKSGTRLTLMSVPGTTMKCSFVPGRSVARGRRGQPTPPATGTEVANPAAVPSPTESPVPTESPMQTASPSPTPRRQRPRPTPSPTPTESPTPTPTEPVPSPTPTEPTPSPSPMPPGSPTPTPSPGEPTPSPTPTASPTPTPTPTPTPRPRLF